MSVSVCVCAEHAGYISYPLFIEAASESVPVSADRVNICCAYYIYTLHPRHTHTRMDVDGAAITAVCSMILAIKHHHFRLEAGREDSQNVRKHSMLLDCTA